MVTFSGYLEEYKVYNIFLNNIQCQHDVEIKKLILNSSIIKYYTL